MNTLRRCIAIFTLSLLFTVSAIGEEVKQEATSGAVAPETKQALTSVATSTADVKQAAEPQHQHPMGKEKRFVAAVGADGVQRVEIIGGSYYFDPNHIIVKVNVPVEFILTKESGFVPHDIVVKAPDAGIDFAVELKKEPQTVKFTPKKTGTYGMFCDKKLLFFKSHKDKGMDGMIEVVE